MASRERVVLMTGIGGQGVQLAARTLAVAATSEELEVMVFGSYGGMMRGGNTDATVIIGREPLRSPPTVARAWAALALHHEFWPPVRDRLVDEGVAVVDRSVFQGDAGYDRGRLIELDATGVATDMGHARGGAMVALGALAAATRLVSIDALDAAAHEVLPPYRSQHADANAAALRAGYGLVDDPHPLAWVA
ncbi:MAG: 2-oxoacid:acceptor oxidoreductase family protein [Acidimicrobiaceae bacterium]|nr:2-oxoacid:acceptor oxidoreductase family protein [Acidimicrobiaceae bacterium]